MTGHQTRRRPLDPHRFAQYAPDQAARRFAPEGREHRHSEYQALFLVSKRTASNDLSEPASYGLLAVEGAGRATRYRLLEPHA